jgi:hypothetical protein
MRLARLIAGSLAELAAMSEVLGTPRLAGSVTVAEARLESWQAATGTHQFASATIDPTTIVGRLASRAWLTDAFTDSWITGGPSSGRASRPGSRACAARTRRRPAASRPSS